MGAFDSIVAYITDKERRLSTKTYVTIIFLTLIIILDNIIGLSYHYSVDKKLNEIQLVGQILKDTTLENNTRSELIALRQELLNKKYFYDYITDGINSLYKKDHLTQIENLIKNVPSPRNNIWFLISASGVFLLLYLLVIIVFPFTDKNNSVGQKIAIEILLIVFGAINTWLLYWLFGFIPKLGDTWTYNYVLNFIIQLLLFTGSIALIMKADKKRKTAGNSK